MLCPISYNFNNNAKVHILSLIAKITTLGTSYLFILGIAVIFSVDYAYIETLWHCQFYLHYLGRTTEIVALLQPQIIHIDSNRAANDVAGCQAWR